MGESKTPFKTNQDQIVGKTKTGKIRKITKFWKPIKTTKVDIAEEKAHRIKWVLKWVLFLPLSAYALMWLLVLFFDLFNF